MRKIEVTWIVSKSTLDYRKSAETGAMRTTTHCERGTTDSGNQPFESPLTLFTLDKNFLPSF